MEIQSSFASSLTPTIRKLATHSSTGLQELINHIYQRSLQSETDEGLTTSFKLLIHMSTLDLAAYAPLAQTTGNVRGVSKRQPEYTLLISLIHTLSVAIQCDMRDREKAKMGR